MDRSQSEHGGTLAPFRHPSFRAIWIASLISNFGSMIQSVGASWLMTSLAPGADMVALVLSATTLPMLLLALVSGAIADTADRRAVMLTAQGLLLGASILLATLTLLGLITPWSLLALTFVIGCGTALYGPSWQASVGDHVPRQTVPAAVALNSTGFNLARTLGPALGGLIVTAAGALAAFLVNTITYVGLIVVLARWRPVKAAPAHPREPLATAMGTGLRYVRETPQLRAVLTRGLAVGLSASAVWGLMPLVARDLLGGGPATYGLLLGAFGAGAVGGALGGTRIRRQTSHEVAVRAAACTFAAGAGVAAISPWAPLTVAALFCAGFAWVLATSTMNITIQMISPRWVVGRALSMFQMAAFGAMAVGSWGWGHLAEETSVSVAVAGSAATMLLAAAMGLRLPVAQPPVLELAPLRAPGAPAGIDMSIRSGPVVVTIEYTVPLENAHGFAAAMVEKGRIRRRDGARRWTLLQDIARPTLWVERFESPTWGDYLRQRQRVTVADSDIEQRVRAYHTGEGAPEVRRFVERGQRVVGPREPPPPIPAQDLGV